MRTITSAVVLLLTMAMMMMKTCLCKSVIIANYHNILLFFPKELGGNDDLRVIFDVRNSTSAISQFKYMPVVVSVAYDSEQNQAYAYLESAVTSYIVMLKWAGGQWCHQVLFDFPASQFSKYMYHSIVLIDNFIYWTTDRFVMSGRVPGYEKRLLLQPAWNKLYSMTADKENQMMYIAAFDYTENALFRCSLRIFSCSKMLSSEFPMNYITFNTFDKNLYVATIQPPQSDEEKNNANIKDDPDSAPISNYLYRYTPDFNSLMPVLTVDTEISTIAFIDEERAVVSNQQTIALIANINMPNTTRKARAHLIDPYALQYVFTFNQVASFDTYPYPYVFSDYHEPLYRNSLFMFYVYACGMQVIENDLVFLPQMDLNSQFLKLDECQALFFHDRDTYFVPAIVLGSVAFVLLLAAIIFFLCRSKMRLCSGRRKVGGKQRGHRPLKNVTAGSSILVKSSPPDSSAIGSISSELSKKLELLSAGGEIGHDNIVFYSSPSILTQSVAPPSLAAVSSICGGGDESYDNDPIDLESVEYYGSNLMNRRQQRTAYQTNTVYIYGGSGNVNSVKKSGGPSISQTSVGSDSTTTCSSSTNNQRVKFNDYRIEHFFYDREQDDDDEDDDDDDSIGNEFPRHSKIYNQDEIPPKKRKSSSEKRINDYTRQQQQKVKLSSSVTSTSNSSSLGSLSFTDKDDGELALDINKLSQMERKLAKYSNKDYISTCNVALYGAPTNTSGSYVASNYLNILKAMGGNGGVIVNNRQQKSVARIVNDNIEI